MNRQRFLYELDKGQMEAACMLAGGLSWVIPTRCKPPMVADVLWLSEDLERCKSVTQPGRFNLHADFCCQTGRHGGCQAEPT